MSNHILIKHIIFIILFQCEFAFAAGDQSSHWNIVDYLSQKKRIGMQDLWLLKNTKKKSSISSEILGYRLQYRHETTGVQPVSESKQHLTGYQGAFYYSKIGFEGRYEETSMHEMGRSGGLGLLILGSSLEDTYLKATVGLLDWRSKIQQTEEFWHHYYYGAKLNLFIFDFFGIHGSWKKIPDNTSNNGVNLSSEELDWGGFFQFGPIRLSGGPTQRTWRVHSNSGDSKSVAQGIKFDVSLTFF